MLIGFLKVSYFFDIIFQVRLQLKLVYVPSFTFNYPQIKYKWIRIEKLHHEKMEKILLKI